MIVNKRWQYFDWFDKNTNMELYGSEEPPVIDIFKSHKELPMLIFAGKHDKVVNIEDIREALPKIQNPLEYFECDGDHLSLLLGKDMSYVESMITLIKKKVNEFD